MGDSSGVCVSGLVPSIRRVRVTDRRITWAAAAAPSSGSAHFGTTGSPSDHYRRVLCIRCPARRNCLEFSSQRSRSQNGSINRFGDCPRLGVSPKSWVPFCTRCDQLAGSWTCPTYPTGVPSDTRHSSRAWNGLTSRTDFFCRISVLGCFRHHSRGPNGISASVCGHYAFTRGTHRVVRATVPGSNGFRGSWRCDRCVADAKSWG